MPKPGESTAIRYSERVEDDLIYADGEFIELIYADGEIHPDPVQAKQKVKKEN
jgi:hypothetical protein